MKETMMRSVGRRGRGEMEQPGDLAASLFQHVAFVLAIEATYVVKLHSKLRV